jgi:hypothetical protein
VGFYDKFGHDGFVAVAVSGRYAYVTTYIGRWEQAPYGGLTIIDVSAPSAPFKVDFYRLDPFNGFSVAASGGYAYVVDSFYGLQAIDASIPRAHVEVGTCDTHGSGYDVVVSGGLIYVADAEAGMQIFRDCHVFKDGFESSDTTAWSPTTAATAGHRRWTGRASPLP